MTPASGEEPNSKASKQAHSKDVSTVEQTGGQSVDESPQRVVVKKASAAPQ